MKCNGIWTIGEGRGGEEGEEVRNEKFGDRFETETTTTTRTTKTTITTK
jgi:hypothetical protein